MPKAVNLKAEKKGKRDERRDGNAPYEAAQVRLAPLAQRESSLLTTYWSEST